MPTPDKTLIGELALLPISVRGELIDFIANSSKSWGKPNETFENLTIAIQIGAIKSRGLAS